MCEASSLVTRRKKEDAKQTWKLKVEREVMHLRRGLGICILHLLRLWRVLHTMTWRQRDVNFWPKCYHSDRKGVQTIHLQSWKWRRGKAITCTGGGAGAGATAAVAGIMYCICGTALI